jgi:exodeoxyribonuclease-5
MSYLVLSPDQARALDSVEQWLESGDQRLTLGGYAGTGKTTLIRELLRRHSASVCAFTGKAAFVLQSKGVEATTMHRLLYKPMQLGSELKFVLVEELPVPLVIVDEASMVDVNLMRDLESFRVKVLYVGDHGQLEPVGNDPGLMRSPDVRLEQIHRQASGSAIIQFAHHVRSGGEPTSFGHEAELLDRAPASLLLDHDAILCGFNRTRVDVNRRIREQLGFHGRLPVVGERVICLRNNRDYGVFNGMQATVLDVEDADDHRLHMVVEDDMGNKTPRMVCEARQFGAERTLQKTRYEVALWDWGYALTVHKSQGSEWPRVLVLEQIHADWSADRWRYTAATRAAEKLTYVRRTA